MFARHKKFKLIMSIVITLVLVTAMLPSFAMAAGSTVTVEVSDKSSSSARIKIITNLASGDSVPANTMIQVTRSFYQGSWRLDKVFDYAYSDYVPVDMTDLFPDTEYRLTVTFTLTSGDVLTYSAYFTTDKVEPICKLTTPIISNATETEAVANATFEMSVNLATQVGFVYSTTTQYPEVNSASSVTKVSSNPNSSYGPIPSVALTGLVNTTYYIRAFASYNNNGVLTTAYSETYTYVHKATGSPQVSTSDYNYEDGRITLYGRIDEYGTTNVTERGFVYSYSISEPTVSLRDEMITTYGSDRTFQEYFTPQVNATVCYVRAYARNSAGYGYGLTKTINLTDQKPTVSTTSVDYVSASGAEVTINVLSAGTSKIIERGVVYSTSNYNPEIDSANTMIQETTGTTGVASLTIDDLERNTTYYVRAYAKNSSGTSYGEVKDFRTTNLDVITTFPVTDISSYSAIVTGEVSRNLDYTVKSRGVVYSSVNTTPTINNSQRKEDIDAMYGAFSVELTDLAKNTKYYVRSYVFTNQGYTYGNIRSFTTEDSTSVKTNAVEDVRNSQATIYATALSDTGVTVSERGAVFSKSNSTPTMANSEYKVADVVGTGDYRVTISGLTSGTKYYTRAYVKVGQSYIYGAIKEFTTSNKLELTINYRTANNTLIGSEILTIASVGSTIVTNNLTVPTGYYLVTSNFTHVVTTSTAVDVVVAPIAELNEEKEFIEGVGNYMFAPDRNATRLEIAKLVYNLRGNSGNYLGQGMNFTDVPSYLDGANAVAFVSSMGYMTGMGDNSFGANQMVTRAQIAVVVNKVFNYTALSTAAAPFSDVRGHWGEEVIRIAAQNNVLSGYEGKFMPDDPVTRAQVTAIFSRAAKRTLKPLGTANFIDVPSDNWAYPYIMNAAIPR